MSRHLFAILTTLILCFQGIAPAFSEVSVQGRSARSLDFASGSKAVPNVFNVEPEVLSQLRVEGFREGPGASMSAKKKHLCDCSLPELSVHSSQVELVWDEDHDGYFQQFIVSFDADISAARSYVFVKAYLSFEGGPWNYVYTTKNFRLEGASSSDGYSIETVLDSGYPTGYYDVLLEFYDAESGEYLSSYGPNEDLGLYAIPLEDQSRDRRSGTDVSYEVDTYLYGSGSVDPFSLLVAGLLFGRFSQQLRTT